MLTRDHMLTRDTPQTKTGHEQDAATTGILNSLLASAPTTAATRGAHGSDDGGAAVLPPVLQNMLTAPQTDSWSAASPAHARRMRTATVAPKRGGNVRSGSATGSSAHTDQTVAGQRARQYTRSVDVPNAKNAMVVATWQEGESGGGATEAQLRGLLNAYGVLPICSVVPYP